MLVSDGWVYLINGRGRSESCSCLIVWMINEWSWPMVIHISGMLIDSWAFSLPSTIKCRSLSTTSNTENRNLGSNSWGETTYIQLWGHFSPIVKSMHRRNQLNLKDSRAQDATAGEGVKVWRCEAIISVWHPASGDCSTVTSKSALQLVVSARDFGLFRRRVKAGIEDV